MRVIAGSVILFTLVVTAKGAATFSPTKEDIVAVIGGEDMVAWQKNGYFETLATAGFGADGPRFRYLAWEGDTVFEQPRDLNFPKWPEQLRRAGATMLLCQFGQAESLRGREALPSFVAAYEKLLGTFAAHTSRIVLLSPIPFENPPGVTLDTAGRNATLAVYVEAIGQIAERRQCGFIDLYGPLLRVSGSQPRLTRDGLHLNAFGHWFAAREAGRQLGWIRTEATTDEPAGDGALPSHALESLRRVIVAKNQLWFDYWRPQNWAFLAGDRTEQPSSRDHRDPQVRWFPKEMEEFLPRIVAKEREIGELAKKLK